MVAIEGMQEESSATRNHTDGGVKFRCTVYELNCTVHTVKMLSGNTIRSVFTHTRVPAQTCWRGHPKPISSQMRIFNNSANLEQSKVVTLPPTQPFFSDEDVS